MGFLGEWRASRERRRLAETYVRHILSPQGHDDLAWLSSRIGNREIASRELTFATRAICLIVAERDALDDRTASDVVHALAPILERESRRSAEHGQQWLARRRDYATAMATRGQSDEPAVRLARVLLAGAGLSTVGPDDLARATHAIQVERTRANEALRSVFGEASLPEDVRPSAIRP